MFCYYGADVIPSIVVSNATSVKDFNGDFNYADCLVSNSGNDTPHTWV